MYILRRMCMQGQAVYFCCSIKSFVKVINFSVLLFRYLPFCHTSPISCVIVGVIGIPLIPCIFLRSEE